MSKSFRKHLMIHVKEPLRSIYYKYIRRKVKQRLKKGEYLNENEEEEDFINKHGDYYIKFNKTYYDGLNEEDKDKYLRYFSNK